MITDPLADLLTRLKNARMSHHRELVVPLSRQKEALVKLLAGIKYVDSFSVKGKEMIIKNPRLSVAKRLSKPGSRLYASVEDLRPYRRGLGQTIVSTSKGLLTAREAFKEKLGGELIAYVQK